jgi:hypothetical protein
MTGRVRFLILTSYNLLSNYIGILLQSFDEISERLDKCLPPSKDQLFPAEAVFPLTPPLSDDPDVPDGCRYKGKSYIKTIHAGGTADRLRKSNRNRPRIQHHRGFIRCNTGYI